MDSKNHETAFKEYMSSDNVLETLRHALFHSDSVRTHEPILIEFVRWVPTKINELDVESGDSCAFLFGQIISRLASNVGDYKDLSEAILESIQILPEADEISRAIEKLHVQSIKPQWFESLGHYSRSHKKRGLLSMVLINAPAICNQNSKDGSANFTAVVEVFKAHGVPIYRALNDNCRSQLDQHPSLFARLLHQSIGGDVSVNYGSLIAAVFKAQKQRNFENCVDAIIASMEHFCACSKDPFIMLLSKDIKIEAISRIIKEDYSLLRNHREKWSDIPFIAIQMAILAYLDGEDLISMTKNDELLEYLSGSYGAQARAYQALPEDHTTVKFNKWLKENLPSEKYELYALMKAVS